MTAALCASLEALAAAVDAMGGRSAAYTDTMLHPVPDAPSVDRAAWLLARLRGKTVLHIGCGGPLHAQLSRVCARLYGVDQVPVPIPDTWAMDVETQPLPRLEGIESVLLGEVLEHVRNPGTLLDTVRQTYAGAEVLLTVPNAGSEILQQHLRRGVENVNVDHCAWYSWRTLSTLIEKSGFMPQEFYWYGGKPLVAEGLIFVVRAREGAGHV